jgi:putative tryptophan/tyrosine transport system substrate-binding protein
MKRGIILLALALFVFSSYHVAHAQQPKKVPRIGFQTSSGDPSSPGPQVEAFRQGLRELGYIEGKNIQIDYRFTEGKLESTSSLVAKLLQLKIDVLVSLLVPGIQAAKESTKTVPIVMVTTEDPVATGLIDSLARPGRNVTGITRLTNELNGKRLELLKDLVPTASRVGVLIQTGSPAGARALKEYETAARALKIPVQSVEVEIQGQNPDFQNAFREAVKGRVRALITTRQLLRHRKRIADLSINNRLPLMCDGSDFVEAGGLVSYAANDAENFKRAAYYVDKILRGAKPADLPVEQPTKFELVINLKTAKQIGLTIPPNILTRADRVIR